jgi:hypothetical protein
MQSRRPGISMDRDNHAFSTIKDGDGQNQTTAVGLSTTSRGLSDPGGNFQTLLIAQASSSEIGERSR